MELHPCGGLSTDLTAGCKVLLIDPVVHKGILMLMGASVRVLGGGVDRLESARQRLLAHWNQPLGCSLLSVQVRPVVLYFIRRYPYHAYRASGGQQAGGMCRHAALPSRCSMKPCMLPGPSYQR